MGLSVGTISPCISYWSPRCMPSTVMLCTLNTHKGLCLRLHKAGSTRWDWNGNAPRLWPGAGTWGVSGAVMSSGLPAAGSTDMDRPGGGGG